MERVLAILAIFAIAAFLIWAFTPKPKKQSRNQNSCEGGSGFYFGSKSDKDGDCGWSDSGGGDGGGGD